MSLKKYASTFLAILCVLWLAKALSAAGIPTEVKECVTFIYAPGQQGSPMPNGTGFFVGVSDTTNKDRLFGYLVTARHVLLDQSGKSFPEIFIRLNKKEGGSELLRIPLNGSDAVPVVTHPDDSVDIAVLPLLPSPDRFQLEVIPESMITTKEIFQKQKIQEGDEVFFSGMFMQFLGAARNYPIVRFGRVAMVTDEKIPFQGKMMDLYLLETQSYGGNSGTPVFFNLDPSREANGGLVVAPRILLLAGIMMGSFLDAQELRIAQRNPVPVSVANAGIAAVVPAHHLEDILQSPRLAALRKAAK
jgi:hypothetical protein